jgi:hypothetical protein
MNADDCGSCPTYIGADGTTRIVPVWPWEDYVGPFGGLKRRARFYRKCNPATYITDSGWFVYDPETSAVVDRGPIVGGGITASGSMRECERIADKAIAKYWAARERAVE